MIQSIKTCASDFEFAYSRSTSLTTYTVQFFKFFIHNSQNPGFAKVKSY